MDHTYWENGHGICIMEQQIVKLVRDFHPLPAGRYLVDGAGNGTTFRESFLIPALNEGRSLLIDLDGAPGYPSSFLEEAFGGLVRAQFAPDMIRKLISFKTTQPGFDRYVRRIWDHIDRAAAVVH